MVWEPTTECAYAATMKHVLIFICTTILVAAACDTPPKAPGQLGPSPQSPGPAAYPWHTAITATVFWVGEPIGRGSSEDNARSAYDDEWQLHYGCFDDPVQRSGYYPAGCTPAENPFYLDLPYSDFTDDGTRKPNAVQVIPWARTRSWDESESMMKNQWVELHNPATKQTCYGQIQDAGPYVYDDARYVFGQHDERPLNREARNAGLDVSPALRDCLGFVGDNTDTNTVNWRFTAANRVPDGPWSAIITFSNIFWK